MPALLQGNRLSRWFSGIGCIRLTDNQDGGRKKRSKPENNLSYERRSGCQGRRRQEENEEDREPRPPGKLERLQKILSQAGVASRRHAEEMIVAGRVMVNGQVITQLGAKADAAQDHIRVDGKLLQGAERHRYFVLNKPRGYVTTVSDPEGRPTVMEFFAKMGERLYPVGRLDYLSEGLLLVTNDGALANQLTRASLGVEKPTSSRLPVNPRRKNWTYCAAAWRSSAALRGRLRCALPRRRFGRFARATTPGTKWCSPRGAIVNYARCSLPSALCREDPPRGYGPLVLDVEPGKLRELAPEELTVLRLTADGQDKTAPVEDREDAAQRSRPDRRRTRHPAAGARGQTAQEDGR